VILEDLARPACGQQDLAAPRARITNRKVAVFCDRCVAFTTIALSEEQVHTLRRWSHRALG
jgi:hypothetical protein